MHTVTEMLVNVLSLKSEDDEDDLGVEEDENVLAGSGEQVCGGRRRGGRGVGVEVSICKWV